LQAYLTAGNGCLPSRKHAERIAEGVVTDFIGDAKYISSLREHDVHPEREKGQAKR
jgi:hypothetical protein